MKKSLKDTAREYRFKIEAFTPETMPLLTLTDYLRDVAEMFSAQKNMHLIRIDEGSTSLALLIDRKAEKQIRQRVREIENGTAPQKAIEAFERVNRRLGEQTNGAAIIDPTGDKLIVFPGQEKATLAYGPFSQQDTIDGIPVMVGGTREREVSVHLEGRKKETYVCYASRVVAKRIAAHLFTTVIRVEGTGRWMRHPDGKWEMRYFKINDFESLANTSEISLKKSIEELRAIPARWKEINDPVAEIMRIRHES